MKITRLILSCIAGLLINAVCYAQDSLSTKERPEMALAMRSNGKIYVVVAVVITILLGLILYVVNLDRKIGRLEKGEGNNKSEIT